MLHARGGYRTALLAPWALTWLSLTSTVAAAQGGVVWSAEEDPEPLLRAAAATVGELEWRAEPLRVRPEAPPRIDLAAALDAYRDGDRGACERALEEADVAALVDAERREEASEVLVLRAACASIDGDEEASRRALSAHASLGLPEDALSRTTPPVQAMASEIRRELSAAPRISVPIEVAPPSARVRVDGRPACRARPCVVELPPGVHVVAVRRLGWVPRVLSRHIRDDAGLVVRLERASRAQLARQLGAALRSREPDEPAIAALASRAFAAELLVVLRAAGQTHVASVFERGEPRVEAQPGASAVEALTRALERWRGPAPWYEDAGLWAGLGAGAAVVAGVVAVALYYALPQSTLELFP